MPDHPRHPISPLFIAIYLILLLGGMVLVYQLPQLDFIAAWQDPDATLTVRLFQFISDSISYFSLGIPVILAVMHEFNKQSDKKQSRMSLLYVLVSIAVAGLISYIMKKSFSEPRPYEVDSRIVQLSVGGGYSLPSGHTTEAFASAMALILLYPRWYVFILLVCWASSVGLSRIYLGVHYPFDILVGMFLGSASSFAFYFLLFKKHLNRSAAT